jgi:serine/threonine-protein kinase
MQQIATATPPPPSAANPAVPAMLDLIVARALEKQPNARYQGAAELAADLRACLAELGGPAASTAASGEVTALTAAAAATSMQVDVPLDAAIASVAPAAASVTAFTTTATDPGTHLPLSRKFDSAEALRQLARPTAADGSEAQAASAPGRSGALARLWNPARLVFLLAILAASVAAYYIAYHY